jgi:hypothetical protein
MMLVMYDTSAFFQGPPRAKAVRYVLYNCGAKSETLAQAVAIQASPSEALQGVVGIDHLVQQLINCNCFIVQTQ